MPGGIKFKKLKKKLARKGVRSPGGLSAFIGRKKYGKKGFAKLGATGRKRATARRRKG